MRALFGDPEAVARLRASLEGQLLPRIWGQGSLNCAVSRLPDGAVFGIFFERSMDPVSLYRQSQLAAGRVGAIVEHWRHVGEVPDELERDNMK